MNEPRTRESGASLQVGLTLREEERKVVTVVFADLTGSTALAERLDAEDLRAILTSFFNGVATVVQRFGGTVDKYAGDAVMAVFGAPAAHEDDPERAIGAALGMIEAVERLNADLDRDRGPRLGLRVGVNTGAVIAGSIAPGVQAAYTVVGDAVNTAQRLQSVAPPGGVLVGRTTRRLADRSFSFEELEPVRVKGKTEPVAAFRVLGPRSQPGVSGKLRSALVGREAQLAALVAAVDAVARGEGRIALITGEPGIGKSRLLSEAKRAGNARAVTGLEGRALAIAQGISYGPFVEIVRRDAGIADDDPEAASWDKLARRAQTLFGPDAEVELPFLASLAGLPLRGPAAERTRYLDAQAMGLRIFATARRYVSGLAAQHPLVLVFEDWHWADGSSAALLEHLLPLIETEPLGICVASRPGEPTGAIAQLRQRAERDHGARLVEVPLAPLAPADSERLMHNLLAAGRVPIAIRSLILDKAEGNPFFVEELVRALLDLGGIAYDEQSGEWRPTETLDRITIPDTVQGLLVAYIDRLDEDVKQVAKLASVLGRAFLYRLLQALADETETLDVALAELQHADLIRERTRIPDLEYVFKHALIHDAAYESMLLQRRKELHARAGAVIELVFAGRLEEFFGVLAYHFARAERWEKAQEYLFKAGERAEKIAGDAEALAHYRHAVTAYSRAFGERWDPVSRAGIERRIGEALFRRGDHLEAHEYLDRALALLGVPVPRSRRALLLAIVRELLRQIGHRRLPGFVWRQRHDPAPDEWVRALEVSGWIDFFAEPERLVFDVGRLLNLSEANDHPLGIAYGSMGFGLICDALALPSVARGYYRRSVAVAEKLGHPLAIGLAYNGLAYHEQHARGDGPAADEHYRVSTEAYRSAGDVRRWSSPATLWSTLRRFRGDLDGAIEIGGEVLKAGDDGGDDQMRVWGLRVLGSAYRHRGDLAAAEDHLRRALDLAWLVPDYQSIVSGTGYLAECLLATGRIDDAVAMLEDADRIVRERRIRTFYATATRIALPEAYLAAAERGDRARWLDRAKRALHDADRHARIDQEARPALHRWRGRYEWLSGRPDQARRWWDRSLAFAGTLGSPYEAALTRSERARLDR
ncbi:MAG TPA: adenylate/guanylate cyclase domain-containing protein [Candidatus Limnocylindria bacterium]|nr:adenylate/guanylate cyclase domain-containing protein [Candidatus Limnocylindria bacterium]